MKRVAVYVLHYGSEYLAWSIRSVQDAVDEILVVYTDRPSFGHDTNLICPDTEDDLKREANRFLTKPLVWRSGRWPSEGAHRDEAVRIAQERGADQVLVVDADELWAPGAAQAALEVSAKFIQTRNVLVRFTHFWRSCWWVCEDPCMPVRILNFGGASSQEVFYLTPQEFPVLHFGYAQSSRLVRYKESCHGHKAEWRQGWFESKFNPWTPQSGIKDVHPTCERDFWVPKPVPQNLAPIVSNLLHDHPYLNLEVIP